jgi:hypothetical protein
MSSIDDRVSRSEFAVIIRAAAEAQFRRSGDDVIPLDEAERIAAEAGIEPAEFRSAVQALRARRLGGKRFLGPSGVMSVEHKLPRAVAGEEPYQLLTEGQVSMGLAGAAINQVSENVWRLGQRGQGELQIASHGGQTRIAAISDSRKAKIALLTAPTIAGGIAGSALLSGLAFVGIGTPQALAISNLIGLGAGSALGFAGGRAAWLAYAKASQEKMYSAIERMRALIGNTESSERLL